MVTNALRAYLQLATGLTEVTKQKATDAAKQLSAQLGVQGDEAMATAPIAARSTPSVIALHVAPPLVVFHRPPLRDDAYIVYR